ncbi:MAG: NAD-dependent epimerase/dehydratase family protein [Myxococcota bacterium]|nr:NAD-dependent epimerase/dehydratase family protein [Myxococcota bacterium]
MAKRKKKTVLVTGASGFLGLHLVAELKSQGLQVRSFGRSESEHLAALGVEQVQGSVLDSDACNHVTRGVDAVYHLAGMVSRKPEDSGRLYDVHVVGVRNMLTACTEHGLERVVVASTSGTVGVSKDADFLADESSEVPWKIIGRWAYYESKAYAEREIESFLNRGLPVKVARPTLLLGPGDHSGSSTGDVAKFLSGDVKAALPGGMSFVDARDVAVALPGLLEHGEPGVGYLMGAVNFSIKDFLLGLQQASGVPAPAFALPSAVVSRMRGVFKQASKLSMFGGLDEQTFEMGCHYWYIDSARARAEIGFEPRDWAETLTDTVADIRGIGQPVVDQYATR